MKHSVLMAFRMETLTDFSQMLVSADSAWLLHPR
jgi:hypothetical protein